MGGIPARSLRESPMEEGVPTLTSLGISVKILACQYPEGTQHMQRYSV